jgi:hypothetical protein
MPIEIDATVIEGHGGASKAIRQQVPLLKQFFPQIVDCHPGTINLQLAAPLQVRLPDIVTPVITWGDPPGLDERFGITRIEVLLSGEENRHEAWIYTAERSPHRFNSYVAEIVARPLKDIVPHRRCKIFIGRVMVGFVI